MDSLRTILLILGAVFIALIYAWERIKRNKEDTRYARWGGVGEDDTESHTIGRNSGDLETDSTLQDHAYDTDDSFDTNESFVEDNVDVNNYNDEAISDEDEWQTEVEASLSDETTPTSNDVSYEEETDFDLDSDPELNADPIDDITTELEALEEIISSDQEPAQIEIGDMDVPEIEPQASTRQPDRIIAIHVLAREGATFSGPDILSSLMHLGMQYGDMNVFHCLGVNNKSIFSLVNAVEPGIFNLAEMDELTTPALLLMMSLPNPVAPLEAFDGMLETARSLTASLDGRLCDDTRSVLTKQAIDELRKELATIT